MKAWPARRLGELTDVLSGFAFDSKGFNDSNGLPIVRIRDVIPGTTSTYYRGAFDSQYLVENDDVLIGMDGEFNRARWRGGKALLNQRVCRIASSSQDLDESYLFHFLPAALKAIERVTPFVTVKHLSVRQIRDIPIPLPPVREQQRIAGILDKADALRAQRRAALAKLDALTQSIFIDMFGDPATNPKGWPRTVLGELATEFRYGTSIKSATRGKPALRIPNVVGGAVDLTDLKLVPVDDAECGRLKLRTGDLLFVRTNGNPDFVGRCAVFDSGAVSKTGFAAEEFIFASYLIRARLAIDVIEPMYLREYLLCPEGRRQLRARCKTSAGQYNINTESLTAVPVLFPPIAKQREFAQRVTAVQKAVALQRAALTELDGLFTTLQHGAFRGNL